MSAPQQRRLPGRWRVTWILVVTAIIGFACYGAGRFFWAEHHFRAARRAIARREFSQARQHLAVCLIVWPEDTETLLLAAQTARRDRDYREADRLLAAYRKQGGLPEAVLLEQALAKAQRGQLAEVEGPLWAIVKDDETNAPLALEALAQGYMQMFSLPKALNSLGVLLERRPEDAAVYLWRGWVRVNLRQLSFAAEDYGKAVEIDPENTEARLRLAEVLLHLNEVREALKHFEMLQERQPENPAVLLGLFRCLGAVNRPQDARLVFERFTPAQRETAPVLGERGRMALAAGQFADAEAWLRKSLALAPNERETNYQMLLCLNRMGKSKEAKEHEAKLKRLEEAEEQLDQLFREIVQKPRDLSVRCRAGQALLDGGQEQNGVLMLMGILEEEPNTPAAHEALAKYYNRIGDAEKSRRHARFAP